MGRRSFFFPQAPKSIAVPIMLSFLKHRYPFWQPEIFKTKPASALADDKWTDLSPVEARSEIVRQEAS